MNKRLSVSKTRLSYTQGWGCEVVTIDDPTLQFKATILKLALDPPSDTLTAWTLGTTVT